MADPAPQNLPPLPNLLEQIDFPVYGLASPFLGLQLRSMHYGVDETGDRYVGLGLFYAQKYLGSPKVLAVESSILPDSLQGAASQDVVKWSWTNLVALREAMVRLHGTESVDLLEEDDQDERFTRQLDEIGAQTWSFLTEKSTFPLLVGMEVTRFDNGEIMARRFDGGNMLVSASVGLEPEQFLDTMKQLISLREVPKAALRHQEEFERITAV
jgi:hypothetical protein